MTGQRIGYIRVSTTQQKLDRQLKDVKLDKIFEDKSSGKDLSRPGFQDLLEYIREGDTLIVHSMDRLSRSLKDLLDTMDKFIKNNIKIQFIKENMILDGEASPIANFMLQMMGAFCQFERAVAKERQAEGIAIAREKGVYKERRRHLSEDQLNSIQEKLDQGVTKTAVAQAYGISRMTLLRRLGEYETTKKEEEEKQKIAAQFIS